MPDRGPALWGLDAPFFAPLWRRVAIVGVTAAWAIGELALGSPLWAALFAGIAAVAGWQFFVVNEYGAGGDGE